MLAHLAFISVFSTLVDIVVSKLAVKSKVSRYHLDLLWVLDTIVFIGSLDIEFS